MRRYQPQSVTSRSIRRQVRSKSDTSSVRDTSPPSASSSGKRSQSIIGPAYTWFLELPVPIVLLTMWLAGVVLIALLAGLLYLLWVALITVAAV